MCRDVRGLIVTKHQVNKVVEVCRDVRGLIAEPDGTIEDDLCVP